MAKSKSGSKPLNVSAQEIVPDFIASMMKGKARKVDIIPTVILTMEKLSTMYQEAWVRVAAGGHLPGLPFVVNSKQYHRSIERRQISPTKWEIYTSYTTKSGLSVTELLERGHGLIDLKEGLMKGPKSRMGKNGRYNIVPFRHGVPGTDQIRNNPMPMSVYKNFSSQLKEADQRKKAGAAPTGGRSEVTSSKPGGGRDYSWGERFDKTSKQGIQKKTIMKKGKKIGEYIHKAGKYAGMVAMQASTQKARASGYMTFRIVSASSDPMSWIVPEQPPWPVRKAVTDYMKPFAEEMIQRAIEQDMS